jgi:hypothetical protein
MRNKFKITETSFGFNQTGYMYFEGFKPLRKRSNITSSKIDVRGSLVNTAWRVLRRTPSRYGGWLRIYFISSHGQQTRGGPTAWRMDVVLTTPRLKN